MRQVSSVDTLDPELQKYLELHRDVPPRSPDAAARGRENFMHELDATADPDNPGVISIFTNPIEGIRPRGGQNNSINRSKRFAMTALAGIFVTLLLLLGGASTTAFAAREALPGDVLYPVKAGIEDARVALANDESEQVSLHLELAGSRLEEIKGLVEAGRYDAVQAVAEKFENELEIAAAKVQVVASEDPALANQLAEEVSETLSDYSSTLSALLATAPEPVRPSVRDALTASSSASVQPMGNSGDPGSGTAGSGAGSQPGIETKPGSGLGNQTEPGNENETVNGNEQTNDNEAVNGNETVENENEDTQNTNSDGDTTDSNSNEDIGDNSSADGEEDGDNPNSEDDSDSNEDENSNHGGGSQNPNPNSNGGGNSNSDENENDGGNSGRGNGNGQNNNDRNEGKDKENKDSLILDFSAI